MSFGANKFPGQSDNEFQCYENQHHLAEHEQDRSCRENIKSAFPISLSDVVQHASAYSERIAVGDSILSAVTLTIAPSTYCEGRIFDLLLFMAATVNLAISL